MASWVADYARPNSIDLAQAKAAGCVGIMRYLSHNPEKNCTAAEVAQAHDLDLGVGLVWETTETEALNGEMAGRKDARDANIEAGALGFPMDRPIFYAVDTSATWSQVAAYFAGVQRVGGRPVGIYGDAQATEPSALPWRWQTVAWSRGHRDPGACLFQRNDHPVNLPGNWDFNDVLQPDWGGWAPHPKETRMPDYSPALHLQDIVSACPHPDGGGAILLGVDGSTYVFPANLRGFRGTNGQDYWGARQAAHIELTGDPRRPIAIYATTNEQYRPDPATGGA